MKADDLLKVIGEFGPYQKKVYFFAILPAFLVACETMSVIFIFFIPDHRCKIPGLDNDTYAVTSAAHEDLRNLTIPHTQGTWDACHVYSDVNISAYSQDAQDISLLTNRSISKCSQWVFDHSIFQATIATDFDVVCDNKIRRAESTLISELGTAVGVLIGGFLADRFGRKTTFIVSGISLFAAGIGIAFAKSLAAVNVCRLILGSARQSTFVNGMVLGVELVGPSRRMVAGIGINFFWCLGAFFLALCSYLVRDWRMLEIVVSIPGLFLFAYWWLLPDSPRWLLSRGHDVKAMAVFQKIADSNNTKMPIIDDTKELLDKGTQLSMRHVFRSRELIKRFLIVSSNIFVNVMVYYGVTLNITNLSGDIFVNFVISFILETVAFIVATVALVRMGRKVVYTSSILTGGACCVLSILPVLLDAPSWVVVALSMVGRFFVIISFGVIYLFGAEVFPTVVRSSALSACIALSRMANLLSPFLADLGLLLGGRFRQCLPLVLMGVPAILVGLLSLWLPETHNRPLPETLEDVDTTHEPRRSCCGHADAESETDLDQHDIVLEVNPDTQTVIRTNDATNGEDPV